MKFYEDIKQIMRMKELKSVAWKVYGEDQFKPERVNVRLEDIEGTVFELPIHPDTKLYKGFRNEEEIILNVAFSHFGIIPSGEWIGITTDIDRLVNICRNNLPYDGMFFENERKCLWNGFETPIHVF